MPLYEYQCDACSHRFEVIQKFSDAPVTVCPKCGGAVQKLFSSPAFQFKGSGWYITDYARKSEGSGGTSKGESSGGASKASAAGEAKPSGSTSSDSTAASGSGTSTPTSPAPKAAS